MKIDISVLQRAASLHEKIACDIEPELSRVLPTTEEESFLQADTEPVADLKSFADTISGWSMAYLTLAIPMDREKEILDLDMGMDELLDAMIKNGMQGAVRSNGLEKECLRISEDFRALYLQLSDEIARREG